MVYIFYNSILLSTWLAGSTFQIVLVRTDLKPRDVHNLIFKFLQRPYTFSVTII